MNPLLLIGAAILVTGLLVLVATILLRPASSRSHLSVAELQARLAKEQENESPASEGSEEDETASDEDTRTDSKPRLTMPAVRRQLPYPIAENDDAKPEPTSTTSDKGLQSEAASMANDDGSQSEPTSMTNDDGVQSQAASTTSDDSTKSEPASAPAADLDPAQAQRRAAAAEMLRRITSA
ncbi:hypothetical protein IU459_24485 [Nocardia amamiensis]|uniref:Uncharacterized protein n=1 Tax=Nocardia amamiensis TaxID=404578 RepID=A0ABS0CY19_9NOCA|nr:hypothetical protein [Nocardia amamiensis]MBF6300677.1 hypothetical protein [Nocardia amamiensis]